MAGPGGEPDLVVLDVVRRICGDGDVGVGDEPAGELAQRVRPQSTLAGRKNVAIWAR